MKLDSFTQAYMTAALWSSLDDDCNPLDGKYSISDLATATREKMIADCQAWQARNAVPDYNHGTLLDSELAGHDFWLTRCRHGSGFWDGDLPEDIANNLTADAHAQGNQDLYVGDDGLIYIS